MYKLYYNKNGMEIEVSKVKNFQKWFLEMQCEGEEVVKHNDCFYISKSRKALNTLAKQIKEEWVKETEELLEKYRNIEIKKSYS